MGEVKARANFLREGWIAGENRCEIPPLSAFAAQALDIGQADAPELANQSGICLRELGNFAGAEPLFRRALEACGRSLGPEHADTLASMNNLAVLLHSKGDYAGAEPLQRKALEAQERVLGPEHPDTLTSMNNLGTLLGRQGNYAGAEPLFRRALEGRERVLGPDHPDTLSTLSNLVIIFGQAGRATEAIHFAQREIDAQERRLGSTHPDLIRSLNQHAHVLRRAGLAAKAEPVDRRSVAGTLKAFGEAHPLAIHRRNNLVLTLIMLCKLEEARQILAANWRLNAPPHANTTPRIAFLRQLIALLELQPDTPFLGQLKTLLIGPELPVASDVAVPRDIAYLIELLKPKLGEPHAEFLTVLVAALNHRAKLPDLHRFPHWKDQPAISLDVPWPEQ